MTNEIILKFSTFLANDLIELRNHVRLFQLLDSDRIKSKRIEELDQEAIRIENLIRILQTPQESWSTLSEVFGDFDILSHYLLKYKLKSKESTEIIFYLLVKNLSTNILESQTLLVDSKLLEKYPFQTFSKEEVNQLIFQDAIRKLLDQEEEQLSLEKREQKQEFLEFAKTYCVDIHDLVESHRTIKLHYLDKVTRFQEKDINQVIEALQNLKVNPEICNQIRYELEKKYQKRMLQEKKFVSMNLSLNSSSFSKKTITDKEYNLIKRELKTYYDFYNNQEIKELSFEEKIYCLSLLLKIGEEKKVIEEFMIKTRRHGLSFISLEDWFQKETERLKFYQEKFSLQTKIKDLEQYFQELKRIKDPQNPEYQFWKQILLEELRSIKTEIPEKYEYEIDCAKKLLKKD